MKKIFKILPILLSFTFILSSCSYISIKKKDDTDTIDPDDNNDSNNNNNNNKDNTDTDDKNDAKDDTKTYTYSDLKIYDGSISSSIPLDILPSLGIDLTLYSGYITFAYQTINEDISLNNIKEAFKFHLNVDLYSNEDTYKNSLITSSLIPLIASDFKYQTILDNATDFDIYYNGDGLLYSTISRFKDVKNPERKNRNYLRSLTREVIGTSCFDLSSIFDMLTSTSNETSSASSSLDLSSILSIVSSYLNGLSINIGNLNNLINSITLTILNGGVNIKFEEDGLDILSLTINKILNLVFNALDIDISVSETTPIINLSNIEFSFSPLELSINIETSDSLSSLLDINLKRNDSLEFDIVSSLNLEEDYLIQSSAIKKIDNLYSLYDGIDITSTSFNELDDAIKVINEMNEEEFKRVENFNFYLGYTLLNKNEDDEYEGLNELNNLKSIYASLIKLFDTSLSSDYEYMNALLSLDEFYNKKYSSTIKNNIINKIKENYSSSYVSFNEKMKEYISNYLDNIKNKIDTLLNDYENLEKITLSDTKSLIESIYNLTVSPYIITKDNKETYIDYLEENEEISILDNDTIALFIKYFNIDHELISDTYSQKIYTIISDYYSDVKLLINNIKDSDIKNFNEYSSYLYINESDLDFYSIFKLISNNNSTYSSVIKKVHNDLITSLINKINNFALTRIHEVTTLYKVNFLFNEKSIEKIETKLDDVFNMLEVFISSSLYKKYESTFTYIDEYYLIKEALENQKVLIKEDD